MSEEYDLSIVIPIHNEAENLRPLHEELAVTLPAIPKRAQILFVDDGSTDASSAILDEMASHDPRVTVIPLASRVGQTTALRVGFRSARGTILVPMDGDRQNDPADIPRLVRALEESGPECQAVCGWRRSRQDGFWAKKLPSRLGNWVARRIMRSPVHDTSCTLKAIRATAAKELPLYSGMHRFLPVLLAQIHGSSALREIPIHHRPRIAGRSKYGWSRAGRVLADMETLSLLWQFALDRPRRAARPLPPGALLSIVAATILLASTGATGGILAAVVGGASLYLRDGTLRLAEPLARALFRQSNPPTSNWLVQTAAPIVYVCGLVLAMASFALCISGIVFFFALGRGQMAPMLLGAGLALVAPAMCLRSLAQLGWLASLANLAAEGRETARM